MFGVGFNELVFIFLVVFLLFGPKAIPEIARGLGQAARRFKEEVDKIGQETDIQLPAPPNAVNRHTDATEDQESAANDSP